MARPAASAEFLSDGATIAVTVIDPQPLDRAELIAPDGATVFATDIHRRKLGGPDDAMEPHVGIVGGGGSRSGVDAGIGVSVPVFGWGQHHGTPIESKTRVLVPDMAAYRTTWQLWQIRLRLGAPGGPASFATVPAPEPP